MGQLTTPTPTAAIAFASSRLFMVMFFMIVPPQVLDHMRLAVIPCNGSCMAVANLERAMGFEPTTPTLARFVLYP